MKGRVKINLIGSPILLAVVFLFLAFVPIRAYEPNTAHNALAQKSAQLYRQFYNQTLTNQEISWIQAGARDEDTPPRWINHFYDPQSGLGWTGEHMGVIPASVMKLFSLAALSSEEPKAAPQWAQDQAEQAKYKEFGGNQTWQKAIFDYVKGDKESAFKALGHTLHLIEDMAVPAHTREDTHADVAGDPGEPYEKWTKDNYDLAHLNNFNPKKESLNCSNINDCFLKVAKYSNENFFSEDTIDDKNYKQIFADNKEVKNDYELYHRKDDNGFDYVLAAKDLKNEYITLKQNDVRNSYWRLLSRKAVLGGTEIMRLFFAETARAQADKSLLQPPPESVGAISSLYGSWLTFKNGVSQTLSSAKNSVSQTLNSVKGFFGQATSNLSGSIFSNATQSAVKPENIPITVPIKTALIATPSPSPLSSVSNLLPNPSPVILPANKTVQAREISKTLENQNEAVAQEVVSTIEPPAGILEEISPDQAILPLDSTKNNVSASSTVPVAVPDNNEYNSSALPLSNDNQPEDKEEPAEDEESEETESDKIPPQTTIVAGPANPATSTMAIFIFESSEATSTFACQLDGATSTSCVSPLIYENLAEGAHIFKVWAIDEASNQDDQPAEYAWSIEIYQPVEIQISDYSLSDIDFILNLDSDLADAVFDVQYKATQSVYSDDWRVLAEATTSKAIFFEIDKDNLIYIFRAKAKNDSEESGWAELQVPISLKPVMINEIMYNPGPDREDDYYYEYIELYNRSPIDIDLRDWTINLDGREKNIEPDEIHGNDQIILAPGGLALITDNCSSTSTPSVYDGIFYNNIPENASTTLRLRFGDANLTLKNTGMNVVLKNEKGEIVDQVFYSDSWGGDGNGKSLEKINFHNQYSDNKKAWGESTDGGTPNGQNYSLDISAGSYVSENTVIDRDTVWSNQGSPYYISADASSSPILNEGKTLIIESWATISPLNQENYFLRVDGILKAKGNKKDGGPTITDRISGQEWASGFYFSNKSRDSYLAYAMFGNGAKNSDNIMITAEGSDIRMEYCIFDDIEGSFLKLIDSDSVFIDTIFGASDQAAFVSGNSSPFFSRAMFKGDKQSGFGILVENNASPIFYQAVFRDFSQPIYVKNGYPDFVDNSTFSGNEYDGVFIDKEAVFSKDITWRGSEEYFLDFENEKMPTVAVGAVLIIEPGTDILAARTGTPILKIEGGLLAEGTEDSLIKIECLYDSAMEDDWRTIVFTPGSQATLRNVEILGSYPISGDEDEETLIAKVLDIQEGATVSFENISVE